MANEDDAEFMRMIGKMAAGGPTANPFVPMMALRAQAVEAGFTLPEANSMITAIMLAAIAQSGDSND